MYIVLLKLQFGDILILILWNIVYLCYAMCVRMQAKQKVKHVHIYSDNNHYAKMSKRISHYIKLNSFTAYLFE